MYEKSYRERWGPKFKGIKKATLKTLKGIKKATLHRIPKERNKVMHWQLKIHRQARKQIMDT